MQKQSISMYIIAEVKTKSPFGFVAQKSWEELFHIAESIGDMISIHTDPRWGGSFELLKKARELTIKPILAKGIHESDEKVKRALDCGADSVLVVGRIPRIYLNKCILEPYSIDELKKLPQEVRALWNSRDLKTGGMKRETFAEARKVWQGWLAQASNIKTIDDVLPGADAVLVGAHLESFALSLKK